MLLELLPRQRILVTIHLHRLHKRLLVLSRALKRQVGGPGRLPWLVPLLRHSHLFLLKVFFVRCLTHPKVDALREGLLVGHHLGSWQCYVVEIRPVHGTSLERNVGCCSLRGWFHGWHDAARAPVSVLEAVMSVKKGRSVVAY